MTQEFLPEEPDIAEEVLGSSEFRDYMIKFMQKLPELGQRAALPPEAPGSIEWFMRIGKFWWQNREKVGLTRQELASQLGANVDEIRFLEFGVTSEEVIRGDLPQRYAATLGKPELYETFCQGFGIPKFIPPETPQ